MDNQLPVAADGGLLDIHITVFLSAIDNLLTAGRSNTPTRILTPMKSVVNAVSAIVEDVRLFEFTNLCEATTPGFVVLCLPAAPIP